MKILRLAVAMVLFAAGVAFAGDASDLFRVTTQQIFEGYSSKYVSTATDTVVKASPGVLAGIKITGGTMGTVVVYDGVTCTGTMIDNAAAADVYAGLVMPYGVFASTGICITTGAATKLVVTYK